MRGGGEGCGEEERGVGRRGEGRGEEERGVGRRRGACGRRGGVWEEADVSTMREQNTPHGCTADYCSIESVYTTIYLCRQAVDSANMNSCA